MEQNLPVVNYSAQGQWQWYGVTLAMIGEALTQTIVDPFSCRCFWRLSLNTTYANFDCSNITRNVNTLLVIGANLFAMMRLNWACSINWGCIRHITTKFSTSKICYSCWLDFETRILDIWLLVKFNNTFFCVFRSLSIGAHSALYELFKNTTTRSINSDNGGQNYKISLNLLYSFISSRHLTRPQTFGTICQHLIPFGTIQYH